MTEMPMFSASEASRGFPTARRQLIGLLHSREEWTEVGLRSEMNISVSVLRSLMRQLVEDGEAWIVQSARAHYRTYSVPPRAVVPDVVPTEPLTGAAHAVLARLLLRPDTIRHLCDHLNLGRTQVNSALDELEARRLVERRYVGMLAIYRLKA
ncbi:MarR family transcriptional regulator [Deinococcus peraridilitoris]|uniref:HTH marR-type domain-containing protein n=1 Tax=Deinococcus peraridilitoris (strain DSM 19664 / LMG 22246 / CIP 109416 / KR-200) TaxID=937777 RepID=L0A3A0_DEIPD|nr:helix-turn-helix domain-containing protein [Deinococcus peraridilitoris]AFZ67637.1 hypothetical protein Deipe_2147 [Deinococcus peraridilitoris DSM 19664]